MKRIAYAGLSLCLLAGLVGGCDVQAADTSKSKALFKALLYQDGNGSDPAVTLFQDTETGCQYIQVHGMNAKSVTQRLNSNGQPMCGKTD